MPTTLVAQVDSAYGGKTGVDLPEGKNYAGAYHQPAAVLADPGALATLPPEELAAGWAEVVKTALIAGGPLWARVRSGQAGADRDIVLACARTKLGVVAADERDGGRRQILNLGHTVGHAIETATGYARYRHGEAVGLGLLAALRLSGLGELRDEVAELLAARGLPTRLDDDVDARGGASPPSGATRSAAAGASGSRSSRRRATSASGSRWRPAISRRRGRVGRAMKKRVAVLHGVNLDVLDRRPAEHYGGLSLTALENRIEGFARELDLDLSFFQTNHEGEYVEELHRSSDYADGLILNPGAWTHYAWALRDALEIAALPAVEVHLSDVKAREGVPRALGDLRGLRGHGRRARPGRLPRRARTPQGGHVSRADRVSGRLGAEQIDLLLVTNLVNVRYLTGFTGSNGLAIVGGDVRRFVTDFRYVEMAKAQVADFDREQAPQDFLDRARRGLAGGRAAGRLRGGARDRARAPAPARDRAGADRARAGRGPRRGRAGGQGAGGGRADPRRRRARRRRLRLAASSAA